MATGAWTHNFPGSKDVHPTYIDYDNPGWDTLVAAMFHHIFTALDAMQDALGYDITGGYADLKTWIETLATLTVAQTEVFNANSPNPAAWTDLDVSAVTGSNPSEVMVKFFHVGPPGNIIFRKDGDVDSIQPFGCAGAAAVGNGNYAVFKVPTSDAGVIEWYFSQVGLACIIDVMDVVK